MDPMAAMSFGALFAGERLIGDFSPQHSRNERGLGADVQGVPSKDAGARAIVLVC